MRGVYGSGQSSVQVGSGADCKYEQIGQTRQPRTHWLTDVCVTEAEWKLRRLTELELQKFCVGSAASVVALQEELNLCCAFGDRRDDGHVSGDSGEACGGRGCMGRRHIRAN